jgi:hypothetical protein
MLAEEYLRPVQRRFRAPASPGHLSETHNHPALSKGPSNMSHVQSALYKKHAIGRSPGFLISPFGWAAEPLAVMVNAKPTLLADLFEMSRSRMHLIALALAHLEPPQPSEIGPLLTHGSARQVLDRVLGHCPVGIRRALHRLPVKALQQQNYQRLVLLLADPDSAKVLHHVEKIDDLAIQVLADLPKPLRRPLAFAVSDWPRKLNGLADGLQFLVSRGVASNLDEVVAKQTPMTAWPQLAAVVQFWVESLPLPQMMPPATVGLARRLDRVDDVASLARAWRNCLSTYGTAIDGGSCAVYLWQDAEEPAACLVWRHGRLGWFLDEVKGPGTPISNRNSSKSSAQHLPVSASRRAGLSQPSRASSTRASSPVTAALCHRQKKIDSVQRNGGCLLRLGIARDHAQVIRDGLLSDPKE